MSTLRERTPWLVGLAVVAGIGYWMFNSVYAAPRKQLLEDKRNTEASVASLKKTLSEGEFEVDRKAKALRATTLGAKDDLVKSRFRTGLSRIGEQEGLRNVVVDSGQPQDQTSPLLSTKGIPTNIKTALRKNPDFQTIRGSLKGTGSLEQVLRVVAVAQAQSWLHRVESFSIKPSGAERERFDLRLDVATLFLPNMPSGGIEISEPQIILPPADAEPLWRAVAMKNVFKAPVDAKGQPTARPIEVAAAPAAPAPTPPPQVFAPYDDWKLTGVVIGGRGGSAAFFMNLRTGAKLTVEKGGSVLDATFVEGEGEKAVVEIGGKRFEVANGQTLAARRPL